MRNLNVWHYLFILNLRVSQFWRLLRPCRNAREWFWREEGLFIDFQAILKLKPLDSAWFVEPTRRLLCNSRGFTPYSCCTTFSLTPPSVYLTKFLPVCNLNILACRYLISVCQHFLFLFLPSARSIPKSIEELCFG